MRMSLGRQTTGGRVLATGLRTTDVDPVRYFRTGFAADLRLVGEAGGDFQPARLSVASFCPDYPQVAWYSGPAQAFAQLAEQRWFLGSFFVSQLASQASHSMGVQYYFGPPSILVGLLSSYWNIVHPGFLLLALGLYREAAAAPNTTVGLERLLQAQIEELRATQHLESTVIGNAMATGMGESQIPNTLGPFVPGDFRFRHDPDVVQEWQTCLRRLLRAAAA
jgi:hypothetical protein